MYNRYIPNGGQYTRITVQEESPSPTVPPAEPGTGAVFRSNPLSSFLSGLGDNKKNAGLAGIFDAFKLKDIDTGDILLLLILLFLFRDGEDLELVILLGLILLLGLSDKEDQDTS